MRTSAYRCTILATVLLQAFCAQAQGQTPPPDWPARPVKIIVPFAAGGGSDFVARFVANQLQMALGQPFVVDNKPGAGGNLGAEIGVKSPADGYTLTLIASSYAVNPSVYRLKFDPVQDIAPIVRVAQGPLILVAHPALPARSLQELIALARSQPGRFTFASSGSGSIVHGAGELLKHRAGIQLTHVPYKGTAPALNDTLAGNTDLFFSSAAAAMAQIQAGKLRALAVTTALRTPSLPEVPTVQESGIADYEVTLWHGLIAPAGTPPAIVARINAAVNQMLQSSETEEKLKADGMVPAGGSPSAFALIIKNEVQAWRRLSTTVPLKTE